MKILQFSRCRDHLFVDEGHSVPILVWHRGRAQHGTQLCPPPSPHGVTGSLCPLVNAELTRQNVRPGA